MIDFNKAITSDNPLLIGKAIAQRKKLRLEKLDLIARLQTHDYSKGIARVRAEIKIAIADLREREERQAKLPETLQGIQKDRAKLTREIALLSAQFPKDKAGKLVVKLNKLDLSTEVKEALIRILQSASSG